jgi:predicted urease superfamily metal-dependent hydrolase
MTKELEERLRRMLTRTQKRVAAERAKQKAPKRSNVTSTPAIVGAMKMRDACAYLGGIHPATLRRLVERGLIRPNKVFRHLLFPVDELNRVIEEGMVE